MNPIPLGSIHSIGFDRETACVSILVPAENQSKDAPQWVSLKVSVVVARQLKLGDKLQITVIPEISE